MRLIIAGTRTFNDQYLFDRVMANYAGSFDFKSGYITILCGLCKGADMMGKTYAGANNITVEEFPADWDKHGLKAGPIRNEQMAKEATHCIVFWDGVSRGTLSMINLAKKYNLELTIINYKAS